MSASLIVPGEDRERWLIDELRSVNSRLTPADRDDKFAVMAKSPTAFYRGSAQLYWHDFGRSPLVTAFGGSDTCAWLCGDLHLGNLGSFHDADGQVIFDINDFDEAVVADYQLDLWRLCVSLILTVQAQSHPTQSPQQLVSGCVRGYLETMKACRKHPHAAQLSLTQEQASGQLRRFLVAVEAERSRAGMLAQWTASGPHGTVLAVHENRNLALPTHAILEDIAAAIRDYAKRQATDLRRHHGPHLVSIATRLHAGLGAYGLNRYYVLLERPQRDGLLILDLKHQPEPSPWPYLPKALRRQTDQAADGDCALRTVLGQRQLSVRTDPFLGAIHLGGAGYSVRERSPWKAALPDADLDSGCAEQIGALVARAHARANEALPEAVQEHLHGEKERFLDYTWEVAAGYAAQVTADWKYFRTRLRRHAL